MVILYILLFTTTFTTIAEPETVMGSTTFNLPNASQSIINDKVNAPYQVNNTQTFNTQTFNNETFSNTMNEWGRAHAEHLVNEQNKVLEEHNMPYRLIVDDKGLIRLKDSSGDHLVDLTLHGFNALLVSQYLVFAKKVMETDRNYYAALKTQNGKHHRIAMENMDAAFKFLEKQLLQYANIDKASDELTTPLKKTALQPLEQVADEVNKPLKKTALQPLEQVADEVTMPTNSTALTQELNKQQNSTPAVKTASPEATQDQVKKWASGMNVMNKDEQRYYAMLR